MLQIKVVYAKWMVRARHCDGVPRKAAFRFFRTCPDELEFARLGQLPTGKSKLSALGRAQAVSRASKNNRQVYRARQDLRLVKASAGSILVGRSLLCSAQVAPEACGLEAEAQRRNALFPRF
jgi:hypothetical protein